MKVLDRFLNAGVVPVVVLDNVKNAVPTAKAMVAAHVVAVGNPCRVLREIGEKDRLYYFRERKITL